MRNRGASLNRRKATQGQDAPIETMLFHLQVGTVQCQKLHSRATELLILNILMMVTK
uniref:Uncharacterized protein n=1 Tax=Anguilla anguilla TaxID=7936 RepID=A0A0E9WG33_ANGAN